MIVDNVQFVKRGPFGWINRNRIRTQEGWMWLTVPVLTKGKFFQKINEVEIDNSVPWAKKHWRSIERNYAKAPFFKEYAGHFESIYKIEWDFLNKLSAEIIKTILQIMGIAKPTCTSSELGVQGTATELVINMCKAVKADTYLSGIHGRDYLQQEEFGRNGIKLIFQEFEHPIYTQCQPGEFIPDLSVMDLIFNVGPRSKEVLCT